MANRRLVASLARLLLLGLAALTLIAWLAHAVLAISYPFQLEYGEGAVLAFSTRLARGEALYADPDLPPCVACIYAPLHLWLAGASLSGGRLVAVTATLALLAALFHYLRGRAGSLAAVGGCTLFLLHPLVFNWSVFDRIDMLALCLGFIGLALADRRRDWPAALFLGLACLAKQSYLAAPVAATLAAWWDDAGRGRRMVLGLSLSLVLPLVLLNLASQGQAYRQLFACNAAFAGQWQGDLTLLWLSEFGPSEAVLAILASLYLFRHGPRERVWLLFTVLALAMSLGSGRPGGYYNYFLELHLALCVLGGLALERPGRVGAMLLGLQCLVAGTAPLQPTLYSPWEFLRHETWTLAQGGYPEHFRWEPDQLAPWLAHYPGPVLAENMANPLVLGVFPWYCDVATYRCMADTGLWNQQSMLQRIERAEFALILLQVEEGNLRFTPEAVAAVQRRYRRVAEAGRDSIYRPK